MIPLIGESLLQFQFPFDKMATYFNMFSAVMLHWLMGNSNRSSLSQNSQIVPSASIFSSCRLLLIQIPSQIPRANVGTLSGDNFLRLARLAHKISMQEGTIARSVVVCVDVSPILGSLKVY